MLIRCEDKPGVFDKYVITHRPNRHNCTSHPQPLFARLMFLFSSPEKTLATIQFLNPEKSMQFVSEYSKSVLTDIMKKAGVASILITSTARTPADQARIMYENIERHGVNHQKLLYGTYGDKVIDEYSKHKSKKHHKQFIISMMQAKIIALDPSKVSNHVADPLKLNVIDIAPSSIDPSLRKLFVEAVQDESRITKYFGPPKDPAYHLEIPQPQKPQ